MPLPRTLLATAVALPLPLLLSGCMITPFVRVISHSAPRAVETAAGAHYLDVICPRNAATYDFDAVRTSEDLETLHRAARAASAASAEAAAGLRAEDAPWPASLRADVDLLAESLDLDVRSYDELAAASTLHAARAVRWPGDTSAGDAKFVIRRTLGLSDGRHYDDCVGHYGPATGAADIDAPV